MSRIMQRLVREEFDKSVELLKGVEEDDHMDPDYKEIYSQMLEFGMTAYSAAKEVIEVSGTTQRSLCTLWHHAKIIEKNILEYFGITVESILAELKKEGKVVCPDELLTDFREVIHDESEEFEESVTFKRTGERNKHQRTRRTKRRYTRDIAKLKA